MIATTAKVFMSGNSQAIRLPKEFRVEGEEVFNKALDDVFGCCLDFDAGRDETILIR